MTVDELIAVLQAFRGATPGVGTTEVCYDDYGIQQPISAELIKLEKSQERPGEMVVIF